MKSPVVRRVIWAAIVVASITFLSGCSKSGGGSPTSPSTPTPSSLSVSPSSVTFPAVGGEQEFTVTSGSSWSLSMTNVGWLSVSPMSGSAGSTVVTVTARENGTSPRSLSLVISGQQSVPVTQAGASVVGPKLAYPPPGVSDDVWRILAFYSDGKLRRPERNSTIHLDLSAIALEGRKFVEEMVATASSQMEGFQKWDTTPVAGEVTVPLTVTNADIQCGSVLLKAGACTQPTYDLLGRITGGKMEFTTPHTLVQDRATILHEIYRTMGIVRCNPKDGLMACPAWGTLAPSAEELLMFRGRYDADFNAEAGSR